MPEEYIVTRPQDDATWRSIAEDVYVAPDGVRAKVMEAIQDPDVIGLLSRIVRSGRVASWVNGYRFGSDGVSSPKNPIRWAVIVSDDGCIRIRIRPIPGMAPKIGIIVEFLAELFPADQWSLSETDDNAPVFAAIADRAEAILREYGYYLAR